MQHKTTHPLDIKEVGSNIVVNTEQPLRMKRAKHYSEFHLGLGLVGSREMEGVLLDTALGAVDVLVYYADRLCFSVGVHLC
jgi:hypothetical protein